MEKARIVRRDVPVLESLPAATPSSTASSAASSPSVSSTRPMLPLCCVADTIHVLANLTADSLLLKSIIEVCVRL
jgi:hypothetical protein